VGNDLPTDVSGYHSQPKKYSLVSVFLERCEEEDRSEEERDKHLSIELADFTELLNGLSRVHATYVSQVSPHAFRVQARSRCYLHCILLI